MLIENSVAGFIEEVASSSPAPGGGSVSALAGALGAALASMVCRLTIGKKKYAEHEPAMKAALGKCEALRPKIAALVEEDARAFDGVMRSFGMPKNTDQEKSERERKIEEATQAATLVPLRLMELCADAIELTKIAASNGNPNSISDAGVSALLLQAASSGAGLNVRINIGSIRDGAFVQSCRKRMNAAAGRISRTSAEISGIVESVLPNG
ncbi:MAG TPA: cyclodeaminase/cyclohydrolase family protein [Bacteroidota bacterium]|nr:cyclodeaminase/cyclohydrolase family protein [Bacteroidota bacterium]